MHAIGRVFVTGSKNHVSNPNCVVPFVCTTVRYILGIDLNPCTFLGICSCSYHTNFRYVLFVRVKMMGIPVFLAGGHFVLLVAGCPSFTNEIYHG